MLITVCRVWTVSSTLMTVLLVHVKTAEHATISLTRSAAPALLEPRVCCARWMMMTVWADRASTVERVSTGWAVTSASVRQGLSELVVKRMSTNVFPDHASVRALATAFSWWMIIDVDASKDGLGAIVRQDSPCVKPDLASTALDA